MMLAIAGRMPEESSARERTSAGAGARGRELHTNRMSKPMDEWEALEHAIQQGSWIEALQQAKALQGAWGDAKSAVLMFATVEVEAQMEGLDAALSSLVSLLGERQVDVEAVEAAKVAVRAFFPPEDSA